MNHDQLTLDIYCNDASSAPIYRLYVDDDLITERNYLWNNEREYVKEHCEVELAAGAHNIKIETASDAVFQIKNVQLNNQVIVLDKDDTFTKQ